MYSFAAEAALDFNLGWRLSVGRRAGDALMQFLLLMLLLGLLLRLSLYLSLTFCCCGRRRRRWRAR